MPHGKLTVLVDDATDIKTPGGNGRRGSYCTLACGSQVFSSPTVEGGGRRPLFKTAFEFEIDRTTNELHVYLYSKGYTSGDDDLIGYCTLEFKKVFFHGHTVPLTAYPIQQPSGNPGGRINMSFKFKMRPRPNGHNTHAPMRCSSPPQVVHQIVGRQSLSLDWGYEEDASGAQSYRRTQSDPPPRRHEKYHNFPGTAEDQPKPSFIRYGNSAKLRPQSPQTPNRARPSPMTECNQPIPGEPRPQVVIQPHPRPQVVIQPHPRPQVVIQPQLQMQVQQRPNLLVHFGGEVVHGLAEDIGGELANQLMGGVGQAVMNGVGQGFLGAFCC